MAVKMALTYVQGVLARWTALIKSQLSASQDSGKGVIIVITVTVIK